MTLVASSSMNTTNCINLSAGPKKMTSSDPSLRPLLSELTRALEQERKFHVMAQPSSVNENASEMGEITSGMRDGSAHVLRCLKVWYDLPSDVFFTALSSIDRFLTKMRAQPKHISCIAVSAFHLACAQYQRSHANKKITIPDPTDIVNISQSRCSSSDLLRMQPILARKLGMSAGSNEQPITSLVLFRIMFDVCRTAAVRLNRPDLVPEKIPDYLLYQLEILACDSLTLQFRPAEVALALLATFFQRRVSIGFNGPQVAKSLMGLIGEVQKCCSISSNSFATCLKVVVGQLERYNGEGTVTHRQRLVWKLSNRTLRHLRPTDKLRATLPTIMEASNAARLRSHSECSEQSMESLSSESDSERDMEIDENQ